MGMTYSTEQQIAAFIAARTEDVTPSSSPLCVLDLDGNALLGYNTADNLPLPQTPDVSRRNIPPDADVAALEAAGHISAGLFAQKPMDARLPKPLVAQLNTLAAQNKPFELAVLTSRSEADALELLRDSGVESPESITMIADSGAVMRVGGEREAVRAPSFDEQRFLDGMADVCLAMEVAVNCVIAAHDLPNENRPALILEEKGIASNVHFRTILDHYGAQDNAPLAQDIAAALDEIATGHALQGPQSDGKPAFKLLHGPATVELKLVDIHKGHGLNALVDKALAEGVRPSAVIFAGDDVCSLDKHGNVTPGTDYFAFAALPKISTRTGIPTFAIHTQHAVNGQLDGTEPNPAKAIAPLNGYDDIAPAALTVPSPIELTQVIYTTLTHAHTRSETVHNNASDIARANVGTGHGR